MSAGERWKAKRESGGKTLEDVSRELRISVKYLRGIEEGNFDGWPERVFAQGFIRAYGRLLGEDPEPVLVEFHAALGDRTSEPNTVPGFTPHWIEKERKRGSRMAYYILAALAVLFIGGIVNWVASRSARQPLTSPPIPSERAALPPSPPKDNLVAGPAVAPGKGEPSTVPSPPAPAAKAVPVPAPAVPPAAATSAPAPPPIEAKPAKGTFPWQLYLEAIDQTWLMYSLDDADPVDAMLYPGDKISIEAHRKIFLKLGNAGGVKGTLNGKSIPPFGARGQVKVVTLGE
jgi:cytoskeleton protein RodZ